MAPTRLRIWNLDDLGSLQNTANPLTKAPLSDVGLQKSSMDSVVSVRLRIWGSDPFVDGSD
jgi:hypothetical protein